MSLPGPEHFLFIPAVLLVGFYVGYIVGGKSAEERLARRAKKLKE